MNLTPRTLLRLAVLLALASPTGRAGLELRDYVTLPNGGEIVALYDRPSGSDWALVTDSFAGSAAAPAHHAVQIYAITAGGTLSPVRTVDLNGVGFPGGVPIANVSSVAADPLGRDFGVAAIIPKSPDGVVGATPGKLAFFELSTGNLLRTVDVGYHPDSVSFTPDGARVLVANEGEYNRNTAVPVGTAANEFVPLKGSVGIVDLAGVTAAADLAASAPAVVDVDFSSASLVHGASIAGLRFNATGLDDTTRPFHVEPEYIASSTTQAFVTLQENNALAVVELTGPNAGKVSAVHSLGTITQTIDASDRDVSNSPAVGKIDRNDTVPGLPMPDTVVRFRKGGLSYLATANEGDARPDDGDIVRAGTAGVVDTVDNGAGDLVFPGSLSNVTGIGRLNISRLDGNTDGDAGLEVPTMIGTRSVTLWDENGNKVFDTGDALEKFTALYFPGTFNMNSGNEGLFDTRSDDKGPEPEALAFGEVDGRQYLFIGAERQNGIFQFDLTDLDLTDPASLAAVDPFRLIVGYYNVVDGANGRVDSPAPDRGSPESLQFLPAGSSPTGEALLLVGYEGVPDAGIPGSVAVLGVNSLTVIPEARSWTGALGVLGLALAGLWSRARRR